MHIPPTEIVLSQGGPSRHRPQPAAGNDPPATRQQGETADAVDCGISLEARITLQSLQEHRLVVGDVRVYLSFKTPAIRFL